MLKMGGCNEGMCAPSGKNSTRMQPQKMGRANMAKGGVNEKSDMMKSGKTSMGTARRK